MISEKTLIPISTILVIVGAVFWLTNIYNLANTNAYGIESIKKKVSTTDSKIIERIDLIDQRLSRIEGKLDQIRDNSREDR